METPAAPVKKKPNLLLIIGIALAVAFCCGCIILVVMLALGGQLLDFSVLGQ